MLSAKLGKWETLPSRDAARHLQRAEEVKSRCHWNWKMNGRGPGGQRRTLRGSGSSTGWWQIQEGERYFRWGCGKYSGLWSSENEGCFFFFFSFAIFSFQRRQNSASISKTLFFPPPRRCHCPLRPHVVLGPTLTGPVVVRTQRKSLGGKIKLSLIKLGMFPWVNKKERKGCTNFAAVGRGVRSEAADFLAVLWAASGLNKHLENHHLGHSAPVPSVLLSTFPKLFFPSAWYWSRQCQLHFFSLDSKLLKK